MTMRLLPRVRVLITNPDDPESPIPVQVQIMHPDAVAYDLIRGRRGWPKMEDGMMLFLSFATHHALKRAGQLHHLPAKWEDAADQLEDIAPIDEDGNPTDYDGLGGLSEVTPTTAARD